MTIIPLVTNRNKSEVQFASQCSIRYPDDWQRHNFQVQKFVLVQNACFLWIECIVSSEPLYSVHKCPLNSIEDDARNEQ